jgi:chorismate mutase
LVVKDVGNLKEEYNIPPLQPSRWEDVIKKIRQISEDKEVNPQMIEEIWNILHKESLRVQKYEKKEGK